MNSSAQFHSGLRKKYQLGGHFFIIAGYAVRETIAHTMRIREAVLEIEECI